MQEDPAADQPRTSNQGASPEQAAEGTQDSAEQLPKGPSHRRSSQLPGEQKSQEQDNGVISLTPVKNSKGKVCSATQFGLDLASWLSGKSCIQISSQLCPAWSSGLAQMHCE